MPSFYSFGNKFSFKNSKITLRNSLVSSYNTANIDKAIWDSIVNVTTVGTNGRPSYYGCFDMVGNVFEWITPSGPLTANAVLRGGFWTCCNGGPYALDSRFRTTALANYRWNNQNMGFRVASLSNPSSLPNFVLVGDAGNSNDTVVEFQGSQSYGAVSYQYYINKYKLTNNEYCLFLNSIAQTDTYSLYNNNGAIVRSGSSGSFTYSVKSNYGDKPTTRLTWFDCARYCNWLHNNKPSGAQNSGSTEQGAYTLDGKMNGTIVAKNNDAKYSIPTQDEWYKAAYYKGGGTNKGYWKYATQSNEYPKPVLADEFGNGTLRPPSLNPPITSGSDVSTVPVKDNIFNIGLSLNYQQVNSSGTTKIVPITSSTPTLPANFSLSNNLGKYNITTSSSVSGNIDIRFVLPSSVSLATFNSTKIFHTSNGVTSDVTVTSGVNSPNYSTRTLYGRVSSFSDFHVIPETEIASGQAVPYGVTGVAGNGYVNIGWSMSDVTDIVDYAIKYSSDSGNTWLDYNHIPQTGLSIIVDNLVNNNNYIFKVASISDSGISELSSSSDPLATSAILPSQPTSVTGVAGSSYVDLTWEAPADNGGSDIIDYVVQYSSNNGGAWITATDKVILFPNDISSTRNLTVNNLVDNSYIFKVAAINSAGTGNYSDNSSAITIGSVDLLINGITTEVNEQLLTEESDKLIYA